MFRNSLCSLSHDNKSSQNVCTQLISADLQTCAAAPLASYKLIAMASVRRHLWEDDAGARPGGDHAWERDDDAASESELEDEGEGTQKWAAARLFDILVALYMMSSISAQTMCNICYFVAMAGMPGIVKDYGLPPGRQPGKYQRHLNPLLGFDARRASAYQLKVPGQTATDFGRAELTLPMVPPREAADQDVQEDSSAAVRLQDAIDTDSLPPSYWAHPIVRAATSPVMPYGLYLDGVPYSQTDSVLGVWLFNMITGVRMLIALMPKKVACACGCKGWCSYHGQMQ
jgi:hypothetical protein